MTELQDATSLVVVFVSVGSLAVSIYLLLYDPRVKKRESFRPILAKLTQELRDTRTAAKDPAMDRYIPVPGTWTDHRALFPERIGREVQQFSELCTSYQEKSKEASKTVKLAVYEGLARS